MDLILTVTYWYYAADAGSYRTYHIDINSSPVLLVLFIYDVMGASRPRCVSLSFHRVEKRKSCHLGSRMATEMEEQM